MRSVLMMMRPMSREHGGNARRKRRLSGTEPDRQPAAGIDDRHEPDWNERAEDQRRQHEECKPGPASSQVMKPRDHVDKSTSRHDCRLWVTNGRC
jgi:hypothetical protein